MLKNVRKRGKKMRTFLKIFSILIIAAAAYLISTNTPQSLSISILSKEYTLSFVYIAFAILASGISAGFFWGISYYMNANDKLKEYQRKLEKTSVNAECDSSKVSVLESKIEVLEKALKSALEKNND